MARKHPIIQTINSAGTAMIFNFPIALNPYTAVVSMTIPQTNVDTDNGTSMPKDVDIKLLKALPQTALLTPNHPTSEIVSSTLAINLDPSLPKHDCIATHDGTPKSLPWIAVKQVKSITSA